MKGDTILLIMLSSLLGVLMAFGIAYVIERIREAQGEVEEEYEEHSVPRPQEPDREAVGIEIRGGSLAGYERKYERRSVCADGRVLVRGAGSDEVNRSDKGSDRGGGE